MLLDVKIEDLEKLIGFIPKQSELCKILDYNSSKISARAQRNSDFSDEEVELIEKHYGISLRGNSTEETVAIDYYPEVFGSCGSGKFVLSEEKELIQVPKKLFSHFSGQKHYSVINAIGESMLPNIHPKDRLIVEHWAGEQIRDNQIYVFCYNNEIFVKRLIKNVDEVVIKSDNPDPAYRTRFIEKSDMNNLLIIGEIVGLMRDLR